MARQAGASVLGPVWKINYIEIKKKKSAEKWKLANKVVLKSSLRKAVVILRSTGRLLFFLL